MYYISSTVGFARSGESVDHKPHTPSLGQDALRGLAAEDLIKYREYTTEKKTIAECLSGSGAG